MSTKTVAVDLEASNLQWLEARTHGSGRAGVSHLLNDIVSAARKGESRREPSVESVVGRVKISPEDPDLLAADAALHGLFDRSYGLLSAD